MQIDKSYLAFLTEKERKSFLKWVFQEELRLGRRPVVEKLKVTVWKHECGEYPRPDSEYYFDTYKEAQAFTKKYNKKNNLQKVPGWYKAPGWYMSAEPPVSVRVC